jgi:hypothetical protein
MIINYHLLNNIGILFFIASKNKALFTKNISTLNYFLSVVYNLLDFPSHESRQISCGPSILFDEKVDVSPKVSDEESNPVGAAVANGHRQNRGKPLRQLINVDFHL